MSARIATESLRDLRDALDFAEHDLANGEPGAAHAVRYNRRELESMAHGIASDLLDARDELATAESRIAHALDDAATERTRADAAEAEVARLRAENTRLAHLAGQAADLVVERNHYRERAETHRSRIDWMQSVAASAMRQGLAACRRLRADLARTEAEATRLRAAMRAAMPEHDRMYRTEALSYDYMREEHIHYPRPAWWSDDAVPEPFTAPRVVTGADGSMVLIDPDAAAIVGALYGQRP